MGKSLSVEDFKEAFAKAVEGLKAGEEGTYYWWLKRNDRHNNDWAIVLGWGEGFDEEENNPCRKNGYGICVKIAYQPSNAIMQCDYGIDWNMPYDKNDGECYDTEESIDCTATTDDLENIAGRYLDCWNEYKKTYMANAS